MNDQNQPKELMFFVNKYENGLDGDLFGRGIRLRAANNSRGMSTVNLDDRSKNG